MSDITENMIHQMLYHHRRHRLTSRKARVEHIHLNLNTRDAVLQRGTLIFYGTKYPTYA